MSNIIKKISKIDPLQGLKNKAANNYFKKNDNKLTAFFAPGAATQKRLADGDSKTQAILDPGAYFTKSGTKETRDKVAAIQQEEAAAVVKANAPLAPTYGDAQSAQDSSARFRRRRGVLANIFAGKKTGALAGQQQVLG